MIKICVKLPKGAVLVDNPTLGWVTWTQTLRCKVACRVYPGECSWEIPCEEVRKVGLGRGEKLTLNATVAWIQGFRILEDHKISLYSNKSYTLNIIQIIQKAKAI